MKRTLIAAAFALLTTPVYAQPPSAETIIADNDRNGDKGLSKEEWSPQAPSATPKMPIPTRTAGSTPRNCRP